MSFKTKCAAAISYLSFLLFLVSYLITKNNRDEYMRHHLNQGLNLNIFAIPVVALQQIESTSQIGSILSVVIGILMIWGIVSAFRGKETKIPLLSAFELIK